jgi:hypothetical protein
VAETLLAVGEFIDDVEGPLLFEHADGAADRAQLSAYGGRGFQHFFHERHRPLCPAAICRVASRFSAFPILSVHSLRNRDPAGAVKVAARRLQTGGNGMKAPGTNRIKEEEDLSQGSMARFTEPAARLKRIVAYGDRQAKNRVALEKI